MRLELNSSSFNARCTFRPRIEAATRFSLRGLVRSVRTLATASAAVNRRSLACLPILLPLGLLVGRMAREEPGGGELAELHADHVLADEDRHMLLAVVDAERQAHELRHDGGAARPGLDHVLAAGALHGFGLLEQVSVDERTFPDRAGHVLASLPGVTRADDELVRRLVRTSLAALGRLAPRGDRVAAARGLAFTTAVRVIDRVHGHAAHVGALALVAVAAGLAHDLVHVVGVRHRAHRGHAAVL